MGIFTAIKDIFAPHTSYAKRRENPPVKNGQVKMPPQLDRDTIVDARLAEVKKEFAKIFKEVGTDIGRISGDCGSSDDPCAKWHGKLISVLGKEKGYPTLEDVDAHAVFNSDTYHRVDFVDPTELW